MGNYRFRLSDMLPNAWFYKLKDMAKSRKQTTSTSFKKKPPLTSSQKPHISQPRYTYYITTDPDKPDAYSTSSVNRRSSGFVHSLDSPGNSYKKRCKRKTIYKPSPKLVSSCFAEDCSYGTESNKVCLSVDDDHDYQFSDHSSFTFGSSSSEPDFHESLAHESEQEEEEDGDGYCSSSCHCELFSSINDIVIDVNDESLKRNNQKIDGFKTIPPMELRPIITRPTKSEETACRNLRRSSNFERLSSSRTSLCVKIVREERKIGTNKDQKNSKPQRSSTSSNSTGIRLRTNSPRIGNKKIQANCGRKSTSRNKTLSESCAVVKSSIDPHTDFKESMVEMIIENNIRGKKDLEDLLACYLSLNSKEYHSVIVKAFEQIWFDMADLRL